jgi:hypothetical protein
MKGVVGMTDLPAESAFPPDALRRFINIWYRAGAAAPVFIEILLGLTEREQDEFMAGHDEMWLAKETPERLQRLYAIMTQLHMAWRQQRAEELRNMSAHDGGNRSLPIPIVIDLGISPA